MHFTTTSTLLSLSAFAAAAPFTFPLSNGFPKLSSQALAQVERHAGGPLPNSALPKKLSTASIATFQLVAAQETFEVAYFTSLLNNITLGVEGYKVPGENVDAIREALFRIRAQEELHAFGANAILETAGEKAIAPCEYIFPTRNFKDAITLANTFTDVVLGVLPTVQLLFADDESKDPDELNLILLVGSILGQEAEQNGFYRLLTKKKPSAAPFLTGVPAEFAYSALKTFIVPGSCPVVEKLPIPSFTPITVTNVPGYATDMMLDMEVEGTVDASTQMVTYLSGQNLPVTVPIKSAKKEGSITMFQAELPFLSKHFAKGLTIAAVTEGASSFASAADVAAATKFGPGLIEVL